MTAVRVTSVASISSATVRGGLPANSLMIRSPAGVMTASGMVVFSPLPPVYHHTTRQSSHRFDWVWQKIQATVILSAAKNLAGITEIHRCDQNDKNAKKNCRTGLTWAVRPGILRFSGGATRVFWASFGTPKRPTLASLLAAACGGLVGHGNMEHSAGKSIKFCHRLLRREPFDYSVGVYPEKLLVRPLIVSHRKKRPKVDE